MIRRGGLIALVIAHAACGEWSDVSVGWNAASGQDDASAGADASESRPSRVPWSDAASSACAELSCTAGPRCTLWIGKCAVAPDGSFDPACPSVPERCPDDSWPVCGCDGNTYNSPCRAARAGAGLAHAAACGAR
jgi:hypothetical protein